MPRETESGRWWNTLSLTCVRQAAYISLWIAIVIIIGTTYVYLSNWGPVDKSFLQGPCAVFILLGCILCFEALIGLQGIRLLYTRYGVVTGHFMMSIYLFTIFTSIIAEVWAIAELYTINTAFHGIISDLNAGKTPSVINAENYFSDVFNRLFFASGLDCTAVKTIPFWDWVGNHCPIGISKANCSKCYYYSPSQCQADQNTCYLSLNEQDSVACPYMVCRAGFLNYFVDYMDIVAYCGFAFIIFQLILAIATLFILLHNTYKLTKDPHTKRMSVVKRTVAPKTFNNRRLSYQQPPAHLSNDENTVPFGETRDAVPTSTAISNPKHRHQPDF